MQKKDIKSLLEKVQSGQATPDEEIAAKYWLHQLNEQGDSGLSDEDLLQARGSMWSAINAGKEAVIKPIRLWKRIAVAASILFFLSVAGFFLFHQSKPALVAQNQPVKNDLLPGGNKAVLTLANGKQINITNAVNGQVAQQGSQVITKTSDGQIIYGAAQTGTEVAAMEYNTMTTPRGGQYPLTLSDGTKVWLDAQSSITYPVAFVGKDRPVKITGQVYFEVAHDPAKPFRVTANNQTVEVLGTHFNINAYPDEPAMNTTLFEGSIRLTAGGDKAILTPGQQAQIRQNKIAVISNADLDEAIAWHKGFFQFHDANVPTVMRQLSRWYDVDVSFEGKVPDLTFSGKMYRNITALKVSDLLSYEKIHFHIEGKKIIVMP